MRGPPHQPHSANPPGDPAGSSSVAGKREFGCLLTLDGKGTEAGGGDAPGARDEIPLQPVETMERTSIEVYGGADIQLQTLEDPKLEQMCAQRRM